MTSTSASEVKRLRTLVWIVSLATVGLMFDGYDLERSEAELVCEPARKTISPSALPRGHPV